MIETMNVTGITVDLRRNVLLLHLDGTETGTGALDVTDQRGMLDVGANGWLIGVEIGDRYFPIADVAPGTEHLVRSREAPISLSNEDRVIVVPRRGDGYELSFPSGNQCWLRSTSESGGTPIRLCSTIASSG
ncbi:MAG: hypothetical protein M3440_04490 [Chloroflexota bacterium]|nr:hypothetical protein [Chloroflexota bacterium]